MISINPQRLAAAVIESGLGEVEICVQARVAHQTFRKMLEGQMVRFPSVGRVCKVLAVRPAEILREVASEDLQAGQVLVSEERSGPAEPQDGPQRARVTAIRGVRG